MKKYIIIIILFLLFYPTLNAQWEIMNEGFRGNVNTIDFVNENVGWVAGGLGTLVKTTDGGENWNTIAIEESWYINQIDFISDLTGWAVGSFYTDSNSYAIIIKTINGGSYWSIQEQLQDIFFRTIYVVDDKNIYTLGNSNKDGTQRIFKTTDAGNNWMNVSPNFQDVNFNSLWFQNPETGVVVGNNYTIDRAIILKTSDGGTIWEQTIASEFGGIMDLQFLDDKNGYFRAYSDTINFLCKTEDLCKTWTIKTQGNFWISSYQFLNSDTAYAIMNDSLCNLVKSTDGGINWIKIRSFNQWLNKIYFCNSFSGLSTDGQALYKSKDAGYTWETKKFSFPLADTYFLNNNFGIVGGTVGGWHFPSYFIISSANGGETWNFVNSLSGPGAFNAITFLNDLTGFYLAGGSIYKSSNSGNDWSLVYENNFESTGFEFWGIDICSIDNNNSWAVGSYSMSDSNGAGILSTKNGGGSWKLIWKYPSSGSNWYSLNSISCYGNSCWAVGENGMMVKYTPQTGWEKQTSITDLPLKKVFFQNDNYGWITGGYRTEDDFHSILLKSTDGGKNWKANNLNYLINDICFINIQHGWAAGSDTSFYPLSKGVILETTDGGENWNIEVDNLIGPLNSIFIKDNYAWAVGEYGLVLRTTDLGVTWIDDENNKAYPEAFKLEQNYPNPFNHNTIIKYQIPKQCFVTLKIFDVLGNEIKKLINEEKLSGTYKVEFNSKSGEARNLPAGRQGLPSGVYFYQLRAGSFVETKKMLLLK